MNYKSQGNYKTGGCLKVCKCIDKACELIWAKELEKENKYPLLFQDLHEHIEVIDGVIVWDSRVKGWDELEPHIEDCIDWDEKEYIAWDNVYSSWESYKEEYKQEEK